MFFLGTSHATAQSGPSAPFNLDLVRHTLVKYLLSFEGGSVYIGTGVAIDKELVLINGGVFLREVQRVEIVPDDWTPDRPMRQAELVDLSNPDIAVIRVRGLAAHNKSAVQINRAPLAPGDYVRSVAFQDNPKAKLLTTRPSAGLGRVLSVESGGPDTTPKFIHDANAGSANLGPLINECHQLVGFSIFDPSLSSAEDKVAAIPGAALARILEEEGISHNSVEQACVANPSADDIAAATPPAPTPPDLTSPVPAESVAPPSDVPSLDLSDPEKQNGPTLPDVAEQVPEALALQPPTRIDPTSDLVRQAQIHLRSLGLYGGPLDGKIGPETKRAIKEFQSAQGLVDTGILDPALLSVLAVAANRRGIPEEPPAETVSEPKSPSEEPNSVDLVAPSSEGQPSVKDTSSGNGSSLTGEVPSEDEIGLGIPPVSSPEAHEINGTSFLPSTLSIPGLVAVLVLGFASLTFFVFWRTRRTKITAQSDTVNDEPVVWSIDGTTGDGVSFAFSFRAEELLHAENGFFIGRSNAICQIVIDDESVSRQHARLLYEHGRILLEDLNSSNGTDLDGERLTPYSPVSLTSGAVVALGTTTLRFSGR